MAANASTARRGGGAEASPSITQRIKSLSSPLLWFSFAALALWVGWNGKDTRRLFADEGLGYALGIVGTILILILLVYPVRKRFRWLRVIGSVKNWFQVHMTLGVISTLTILYHCNFAFGSLNSSLALVSLLLVAGSGIIGRFLYAKIHHGLFGRKKQLKELLSGVKLSADESAGAAQFVPGMMQAVAKFDRQVLQPPKTIAESAALPFKLMISTRRGYREIMQLVSLQLELQAGQNPVVAQHRKRLEKACAKYLKKHLRHVRRVAEFAAYEKLFALWHKVHLPFFGLLIATAIVHVFAVHFYSV
ncbi:MAG: hypothetical protein AAGC71_02595 [Pseudomonadota bacterium]